MGMLTDLMKLWPQVHLLQKLAPSVQGIWVIDQAPFHPSFKTLKPNINSPTDKQTNTQVSAGSVLAQLPSPVKVMTWQELRKRR